MENQMKAVCNPARQFVSSSFFCSLLLIAIVATGQSVQAEENPYAEHFQVQNQGGLHSLQANPEPQLFNGSRRDEDNIKMLEDGYDLMGLSSFDAADVPPEQAIEQGRTIKADAILVYVKKASNTSASSKMEMIKEAVKKGQSLTEKDMAADPDKYRYYATFWAKLPPPVLGVHVIKLVQRESSQSSAPAASATPTAGVRVIAVIHGSAAEKGGLLRGDQLLSINQEKVEDAASLSSLARKFKGNLVTLQIERKSDPVSLKIQL
jgi:hypothetical protein